MGTTIKLTDAESGQTISVPADKIEGYRRAFFNPYSEVNFYTMQVKETPEEILQKIKEADNGK